MEDGDREELRENEVNREIDTKMGGNYLLIVVWKMFNILHFTKNSGFEILKESRHHAKLKGKLNK